MKHKWRVQPEPTGQYRSFDGRGWPDATYTDANESICASVECEADYYPRDVKTGNHPLLTLRIADHSQILWKWMQAKKKFTTLAHAKEALVTILKAHPHLVPKEIS